jgi:hypothetical protein
MIAGHGFVTEPTAGHPAARSSSRVLATVSTATRRRAGGAMRRSCGRGLRRDRSGEGGLHASDLDDQARWA